MLKSIRKWIIIMVLKFCLGIGNRMMFCFIPQTQDVEPFSNSAYKMV